jgi:hypothetical protein
VTRGDRLRCTTSCTERTCCVTPTSAAVQRDEKRGIPQGSPLSPLLANLNMRRFVLGWQRKGFEARLKARVVTYADDLVICCKGSAAQALEAMRSVMEQIKLTVNEEKTRACSVYYSPKTGHAYLGARPSRKSIRRVIERLYAQTDVRTGSCASFHSARRSPRPALPAIMPGVGRRPTWRSCGQTWQPASVLLS